MLEDLLLFIPLAVLTNTAFPLPFDPILIWFAGGHTFAEACVFAGFGSGCAGLAALVDVTIIGALGRRLGDRKGTGAPMPPAGRRFYVAAFAVALLPIPYTVLRLALLSVRPRPLLYALIVSVARLPRYLVIIRLWQTLALPGWAGGALVLSAIGWIAWERLRHDHFTNLFFVSPVVHISTPTPCCTRSGKLAFDPSTPLSTRTSCPRSGCRPVR